MSLFATLKRNARASLQGSWGKAILILLLSVGVSMLLMALQASATNLLIPPTEPVALPDGAIDEYFYRMLLNSQPMEYVLLGVFVVLSILLESPLALGVTRWYQALAMGKPAPLSEIFSYFESGTLYLRAVWLNVNLFLRSLLWWAVFFAVPGGLYLVSFRAILAADAAGLPERAATALVGLIIAAVLLLLAAVFYAAFLNRYFLAAYLLAEDDGLGVRQAIRLSVAYSKGYRFSLFGFQLSFIPWFLLALMALFLPLLFVSPYFDAANAQYARFIIEKNRAASPPDETQEFVVERDARE